MERNQVIFSDEYRFNLSSDDNCVRAWRSSGESLYPDLPLQRHTTPTAGVMEWAYDTLSPLILIHSTMKAQWYIHDIPQSHKSPLMVGLPEAIFQQGNA
ncbi:transposable element Tcb2 transposase [Trichonephila clavipes]|nr:transposable element Tcb2 transposase [Trichonephila clavipes]